jgi:hypothetical protein
LLCGLVLTHKFVISSYVVDSPNPSVLCFDEILSCISMITTLSPTSCIPLVVFSAVTQASLILL